MWGRVSLVEALALGRHAVGVDISELAEFVSCAKTFVLEDRELERLTCWARDLASAIHIRKPALHFPKYADAGYYKHLDHPLRWRMRKAMEQALGSAIELGSKRLEHFARCVVLRTGQWALDGRKQLASLPEFRGKLVQNALEMIDSAHELRTAAALHSEAPTIRVI